MAIGFSGSGFARGGIGNPFGLPVPASPNPLNPLVAALGQPKSRPVVQQQTQSPRSDALARALLQGGLQGGNIDTPVELFGRLAQTWAGNRAQDQYLAQQENARKAEEQAQLERFRALADAIARGEDISTAALESGDPEIARSVIEAKLRGAQDVKPTLTEIDDPAGSGGKVKAWVYPDGRPPVVAGGASDTMSPAAFEQQADLAEKGASNVTTNVGGDKIPDVLVKEAVEANSKADMLDNQVNELSQFRDMAMNADTGWFAPMTLPIKAAFEQLGIPIASDVPLLQAMQAQQNQMALRLRNPESGFGLTGNTSNRDVQFLKDAVAGIEKTPAGNRAVLTIMMAKQRRDGMLERAKAEYIFKTGSLAGWGDERKRIVEQTPFLTDDEQLFLDSLRGAPPDGPALRQPANPVGTDIFAPPAISESPPDDGWTVIDGVRIRRKP